MLLAFSSAWGSTDSVPYSSFFAFQSGGLFVLYKNISIYFKLSKLKTGWFIPQPGPLDLTIRN